MDISLSQIASNFTSVRINGVRVWFSFETAVAFSFAGNTVVRQNVWSTTTGKHLSKIDGGTKEAKAARVNTETFETMLNHALSLSYSH